MLAESRPSKLGLLVFSFLMALASRSQAKTIMWLTNWYDSNMDSLIAMDSVYIPNYNGTNGYYFGTSPQMLVPTSAYAPVIAENVGNTEGLPTALTQLWYALPNWNSANYNGGEINVQIRDSAAMHQYNGATQPIQINYKYEDGQTGQLNQANNSAGLPGDVDACVNSIPGDTVWLSPTAKNPVGTYVGDFKFTCSDHNPFFVKVGTVHVYNPWPGKPDFIELGNQFYPTYPDSGRPGWYSTTLYTDPRNPLPFQVRVASGDPTAPGASGILYLDAGGLNGNANGTFFDFTTTPGTGGSVWILPPLVSTTSTITTKAPAVALSLYVQDPPWSTTTLRVVLKGVTADFVPVATQYCGWYLETFYTGAVPTNIVLSQPLGDTLFGAKGQEPLSTSLATYANWITVPPAAGTLWLTTNGVPSFSATEPASTTLCNTKVLAFSGYDYTDGTVAATAYEPFAQGQTGFVVDYPGTTTSTDNCPHSGGGVTEGLVQPTLNAQGRPTWSNKVDCDIGKANDGPQWWYDSLYRSSTGVLSSTAANGGTRLNAFHCIRVPLTMDASGYYDYTNLSFFPFDTATSVPAPYRPGTGDFHFAMHAKAAFEYTPGLQFKFLGDDDVWIFIDKKLALDLGGQHGPQSGTINLDNLGLTEGKSYQFDMFYDERHTTGSDISISTSMNLVPIIDVVWDSTQAKAPIQDYLISTATTTSRTDICPEDGAATSTSLRPANAVITLLFPDGTQLKLDSTFNAPNYPGLTISGQNSHINVDTTAMKKSGKFPQGGLYQILVTVGTDSRAIDFTIVSQTVNVNGTLFDKNGDGHADSVAFHVVGAVPGFQTVTSAVFYWADSSGKADTITVPGTSFTATDAGDSVITASFPPIKFRTSCPATGCTGTMGVVNTTLGGSALANKITVLADGIPPVADSAWLVYDTTGTGKDTLYVIPSEGVTGSATTTPWVIAGGPSHPLPITAIGVVSGGVIKIPLASASDPILPGDSVRLGQQISDLAHNSPGDSSRWVPVHTNPVAKAWMLDTTGMGAPDVIHLDARGNFGGATSVVVHWKTAAGTDTTFSVATPGGLGTSLTLPSGILQNATYCNGCHIDVVSGATTQTFALIDSVAPVAVSASYHYGTSVDTLVVVASEPLTQGNATGENWVAQKSIGTASTSGTLVTSGTPAIAPANTLTFLVPSGTFTGDSLRLRGWSLDASGNVPGQSSGGVSKFVPVVFSAQPVSVAVYDENGDGRADSVVFSLTKSASGAPVPTGFTVQWGGQTISVPNLTAAANGLSWSGPIGPFAAGVTAPLPGEMGVIRVGSDTTTWRARVADSVAPVPTTATLVFGFDPGTSDTLKVNGSEGLKFSGTNYVLLNSDSSNTGAYAPTGAQLVTGGASTTLNLAVPSGSIPNDASWVRFGTSVSDNGGATVGASSLWVKLVTRPSGRAYLFDSDGDGRADSVAVLVRGTLPATTAVLTWTDSTGKADTRTWPVGATSASFGIHPTTPSLWFEKGATSCPANNCTISFLDSTGATLVTWPLVDSVAPMALSGTYTFGTTQDTLTVRFSEPLKQVSPLSSWVEWGNTTTSGAVVHFSAKLTNGGTVAVFVLDTANGATQGWDSVRIATGSLAGKITDAVGVQAGAKSPWAPLTYGLPPMIARVTDPLGKGQGTNVQVRLTRPVPQAAISGISSFQIVWNGETRTVSASSLTYDTTAQTWSGSVGTPFALGNTSAGTVYGATVSGANGTTRGMGLEDGVPPAIMGAQFRYSTAAVGEDTLIVQLSEPWQGEDQQLVDPFVDVKNTANPLAFAPMLGWTLSADGKTLSMAVDTTWATKLVDGDSARLAYLAQGSQIWDAANNRVGAQSRWVPIVFGLRPIEFVIQQIHPMLVDKGDVWTEPGPGVPQTEVLVLDGSNNWVKVDNATQLGAGGSVVGGAPAQNDSSHVMAVYLRLNRPVSGELFVYDNIGVSVLHQDLSALAALWPKGDEDAMHEVRITWNGTGPNGKFVATGIYLMRAVVKVNDGAGHLYYKNLLWKYGWLHGAN